MTQATLRHQLEEMVKFLPDLETPNFDFGTVVCEKGRWPYASHSAWTDGFLARGHELGWFDPGDSFNWVTWMETPEGSRLRDAEGIMQASAHELRKVFYLMRRQERFIDGALLSVFQDGYIAAMVRRMVALLKELT